MELRMLDWRPDGEYCMVEHDLIPLRSTIGSFLNSVLSTTSGIGMRIFYCQLGRKTLNNVVKFMRLVYLTKHHAL